MKPTLNARVRISDPDKCETIDQSFVGKEGVITAVYPPNSNELVETYQVTLPDGRHDMFFDNELEVLP